MDIGGFIGSLGKAAIGTALLPVAVAHDIVTVGDGEPSSTGQMTVAVVGNLVEACDKLGDNK